MPDAFGRKHLHSVEGVKSRLPLGGQILTAVSTTNCGRPPEATRVRTVEQARLCGRLARFLRPSPTGSAAHGCRPRRRRSRCTSRTSNGGAAGRRRFARKSRRSPSTIGQWTTRRRPTTTLCGRSCVAPAANSGWPQPQKTTLQIEALRTVSWRFRKTYVGLRDRAAACGWAAALCRSELVALDVGDHGQVPRSPRPTRHQYHISVDFPICCIYAGVMQHEWIIQI